MNSTKVSILAIDDELDMLKTYENILKKDFTVLLSPSGKDGLQKIEKNDINIVLLDLKMPQMDGIEALKKIKSGYPNVEIIMATASKDIASAVEAMKLGAFHYISKPFDVKELLAILDKAKEKISLVKENIQLKDAVNEVYSDWDLIGKNPKIENIRSLIKSISPTDSTILIQGESGSGKEIVARAIHKTSNRNNKPYVAINCAAIPENLLESELFGHERGAFTGALERRIGKFELADTGTLFLDEIGCMSPAMQSKFLRIIEEKAFERLGSNSKIQSDVRIISATNIDFEKAIKEGKFREDLYYRLNVIPIKLPALRDRIDDLELFISFFINKFNKQFNKNVRSVSANVLKKLKHYDFPGNVRELKNLIERAVALTNGEMVQEENIFGLRSFSSEDANSSGLGLKEACDNFERNLIISTLKKHLWNRTKAAEVLGVARTTLSSRLESLEIITPDES